MTDYFQGILDRLTAIEAAVGITSPLLTELQAINANTDQIELKIDNVETINQAVNLNTDDLETLLRSIAILTGLNGANTGVATFDSGVNGATLSAVIGNDGTSILSVTITSTVVVGLEHLIKAGSSVRITGTSADGTYKVVSVDGLTVKVLGAFSFISDATSRFEVLDTVDTNSLIGRIINVLTAVQLIDDTILSQAATTVGAKVALIGLKDPSGNAATADKAADGGVKVSTVSPPTYPEAGATAYRIVPVDSTGTFLGTAANPERTRNVQPTVPIAQSIAVTAVSGALSGFVGGAAAPVLDEVTLLSLSTNTNTIYIGPSGVTTATGFPLEPGASKEYRIDNVSSLFAVSGGGTQTLKVGGS